MKQYQYYLKSADRKLVKLIFSNYVDFSPPYLARLSEEGNCRRAMSREKDLYFRVLSFRFLPE